MTQQDYEQKKVDCWNELFAANPTRCDIDAFDAIFDRAYALGKQEKDAEGEEMLTVSRKQIDVLQSEIFKTIMDAHDADDWQDAAHYILDVMPRSFAALFGSKCLPYELNEDNFTKSEPKPAELKFKVGDKVRVCSKDAERYGKIGEVIQVYPSGVVDIDFGDGYVGGHFYGAWAIEPYTEPTANYVQVDYHGADTAASTIADSCQSQPVTDYFDRIIKDGFRGHNRLYIAAQIVAALYANHKAAKGFKSIEELVRKALDIADTLIKESEKGGSK